MSTVIMSDQVQHSYVHQWTGAANNSPSVELVDGIESRRNLVLNPSFTTDFSSWQAGSANGVSSRDTTTYHSGSAGGKFVAVPGVQALGAFYTEALPVESGQSYTISYWAMVPTDLTASYSIAVVFYDAANVYIDSQLSITPLSFATDWTRVSVAVVVPETAVSMRFNLLNSSPTKPTVAETIYFDDVMVETGVDTQEYFDGSTPAQYFYGQANPLVVDGWAESSNSRNIVNPIVGGGVDYVLYPSDLRAGTFTMLFGDEQEAVDAFNMHRQPALFTLTDTDRPSIGMSYISNGTTQRVLDDQLRKYWLVSVTYQEVEPE